MPHCANQTSYKKGDKRLYTKEHLGRLSKHWKGKDNPMYGKKREDLLKMNKLRKGKTTKELYGENSKRHEKAVLEQMKELIRQEFKVLNADRARPDIFALKDGKIYAIEVEFGKTPDYGKYKGNTFFDDVIWVLKNKKESA